VGTGREEKSPARRGEPFGGGGTQKEAPGESGEKRSAKQTRLGGCGFGKKTSLGDEALRRPGGGGVRQKSNKKKKRGRNPAGVKNKKLKTNISQKLGQPGGNRQ